MTTVPNESIFPASEPEGRGYAIEFSDEVKPAGLTKREYFAAIAMQGILSDPHAENEEFDKVASDAVFMADALIAALNGEGQSNG